MYPRGTCYSHAFSSPFSFFVTFIFLFLFLYCVTFNLLQFGKICLRIEPLLFLHALLLFIPWQKQHLFYHSLHLFLSLYPIIFVLSIVLFLSEGFSIDKFFSFWLDLAPSAFFSSPIHLSPAFFLLFLLFPSSFSSFLLSFSTQCFLPILYNVRETRN